MISSSDACSHNWSVKQNSAFIKRVREREREWERNLTDIIQRSRQSERERERESKGIIYKAFVQMYLWSVTTRWFDTYQPYNDAKDVAGKVSASATLSNRSTSSSTAAAVGLRLGSCCLRFWQLVSRAVGNQELLRHRFGLANPHDLLSQFNGKLVLDTTWPCWAPKCKHYYLVVYSEKNGIQMVLKAS